MKLSPSFLFAFLLLSSHFNIAVGGKKEANEKARRDIQRARKDTAEGMMSQPTNPPPPTAPPIATFPTTLPPTMMSPSTNPPPTTAPPTATFPTTLPPTMMSPPPTNCIDHTFEFELRTDNYAGETTWELTDSFGTIVADRTDRSWYAEKNTNYDKESYCIGEGEHTFTIYDSYGDGICCKWGTGAYSIYLDGSQVKTGGKFDSSESTTLGVSTSSMMPTAEEEEGCPGGMKSFALHLRTDFYASDTTWNIRDSSNNVVGDSVSVGVEYEPHTEYDWKTCLLIGESYTFTIDDSYWDGICCEHGPGFFRISLDGNLIGGGGYFGASDSETFSV